MSNILLYPMEDKYKTKLTQEYDGVSLGSIYVQETPSFTLPSGTKFCIVLSPNTSIQQAVIVDGFNSGAKTLNVSDASINKGPGLPYTQSTHPVGAEVIITDNFAHWEEIVSAVNSKLDQTGGTVSSFSLGVTGSNWRIRKDGSDMKFRDDNQSEVTLSTIASTGSDEKTKVSVSDTTSGYLDGKLTAGDGLSKTIVNSGGNESLDLDIDLSDTTIFTTTQGNAGKALKLDGSGNIDSSFDASTTRKGLAEMATDAEARAGTDQARYINAKQLIEEVTLRPGVIVAGTTYTATSYTSTVFFSESSYTRKYGGSILRGGTYTMSIDLGSSTGSTSFCRIYRNGSPFGTEFSKSNSGSNTFSEDLTFATGDVVDVYVKHSGGSSGSIANYSLKYDMGFGTYTFTTAP